MGFDISFNVDEGISLSSQFSQMHKTNLCAHPHPCNHPTASTISAHHLLTKSSSSPTPSSLPTSLFLSSSKHHKSPPAARDRTMWKCVGERKAAHNFGMGAFSPVRESFRMASSVRGFCCCSRLHSRKNQ